MKAGFIGLGAMGLPMASNLQRKGFQLSVFDLEPSKMDHLAALGATKASSIAEACHDADVVITMLPATQHVEQVILGPDGVLASISPPTVIMDMSTIDPQMTDQIAVRCADAGIGFTDCPVGRLALHAEKGESLFMVGADDTSFQRIEPLLQAMGTTVFRCGKPGTGARMKVINNFMLLSIAQVCAEAITLGTALGLSVETIRDVTGATTATNGQLQVLMVNKVLQGDIKPGFTIDLAFKDMTLAINAAAQHRMGLPTGSAVHAVYSAARATHYATADYSALLSLACDHAGIETPRLKKPM